jgi:hypothetical protein
MLTSDLSARYRGRDVVIPPVVELELDTLLGVDSLVDSLMVPPAVPPLPESLPPAPDSTRDSVPPNDTGPASRRP